MVILPYLTATGIALRIFQRSFILSMKPICSLGFNAGSSMHWKLRMALIRLCINSLSSGAMESNSDSILLRSRQACPLMPSKSTCIKYSCSIILQPSPMTPTSFQTSYISFSGDVPVIQWTQLSMWKPLRFHDVHCPPITVCPSKISLSNPLICA